MNDQTLPDGRLVESIAGRSRMFKFLEITPDDPIWLDALAGADHDIYHRPEYVSIEADRTGSRAAAGFVSWDSGALLVPYLDRRVDHLPGIEAKDATSPYGYSGALHIGESDLPTRRAAVASLWQGMRELGFCSVFLRMHPVLDAANDAFKLDELHHSGDSIIVDLTCSEEDLWRGIRKGTRRAIRRSLEAGMTVDIAAVSAAALPEFTEIYFETMRRVNAEPVYYTFDLEYALRLQTELGSYLDIVKVLLGDRTICISLSSRVGSIVQPLLGGTRTADLPLEPNVLKTYGLITWYRDAGIETINLGGGVGGKQDSLFHFKQSFSKNSRPFYSVRAVLDLATYKQLVAERARAVGVSVDKLLAAGFFPAYRATP